MLVLVAAGANLLSALLVRPTAQHDLPGIFAWITSGTVFIAIIFALAGIRWLPSRMLPSALVGTAALFPFLYNPLRRLQASGFLFAGLALLALLAACHRGVGHRWLVGARAVASSIVLWCLVALSWSPDGGIAVTLPLVLPILLGVIGLVAYAARPRGWYSPARIALAMLATLLLAPAIHSFGGHLSARLVNRPANRLDIVLLTIDALRADALTPELAPNLVHLRSQSLRFTQARTPAPWTRPAMASILTGLPPLTHQTGLRNVSLSEGIDTLAERLRAGGYHTAAVVRNANLAPEFGLSQGFEEYHHLPLLLGTSWGDMVLRAARRLGAWPDDATSLVALTAESWLASPPRSPYFLWLHFLDPHAPYSVPTDLQPDGGAARNAVPDPSAWAPPPGDLAQDLPAAGRRWIGRMYRAEVRYVDRAVGKVLRELDRNGFWDRGVLVLTADHGEELWDRGAFGHAHSLYDEVLRVPLMVRAPGLDPETRAEPTSTAWITPELLHLAGLGPAVKPEGSTLSSGLRDGSFHHALVFGNLKLIVSDGDAPRLYDLRDDPGERSPLPGDADGLARLAAELEARRDSAEALRERLAIPLGTSQDLDEDTLRDLRALGYLR